MNKKILVPAMVGLLIFFSNSVSAGPTAIRDDRVTDIAVTPALGRGYSIATSTFQSLCMSSIAITKPSYNFTYKFEEMNEDGTTTDRVKVKGGVAVSGATPKFSGRAKLTFGVATGTEEKWNSHSILVTIMMDVYYASVDESQSKLSQGAADLLQKDDIPGFFDSCGPYYVRSIGRHAKFTSIFTYVSKSEKRDTEFETALEVSLKGMMPRGPTLDAGLSVEGQVKKTLSKYSIIIDTAAWGLGKDRMANLISYDIDSFKKSIQDAFLSMTDEATGLVTSIEVVPWVEFVEFQRLVQLKDETKPAEGGDKGEKSGQQGEVVNTYIQKRIINGNAEFIAEVDRATRNRLNIYYKAKLCQLRLGDYQSKNDPNKPDDTYADYLMINNKTGDTKEKVTMAVLFDNVNSKKTEEYLKEYTDFVYGSEKTPSVQLCMKEMKSKNFRITSYREIESCRALEGKFAAMQGKMVDDYCMPQVSGEKKEQPK